MIDLIIHYYNLYMQLIEKNPIFGSAIFMAVAGFIFVTGKSAFLSVYRFITDVISKLFISKLYVEYDESYGWTDMSITNMAFSAWYQNTKLGKMLVNSYRARSERRNNRWVTESEPNHGLYFFILNGLPGYFIRAERELDNKIIQTLTIVYFGKSDVLTKFIYRLSYEYAQKENVDKIALKSMVDGIWSIDCYIPKRATDTVITKDDAIYKIINLIEKFLASEKWYVERGFNYKLNILLSGPPGTGKSSIIKAVASHFNRSLSKFSNAQTASVLTSISDDTIVYWEEMDTRISSKKRSNLQESTSLTESAIPLRETKAETGSILNAMAEEELSELLNIMDGIETPHGLILMCTTNRKDELDKALVRDERIDAHFIIDYLDHPAICKYINRFYPEFTIPTNLVFVDVPGSTLQKYLKKCKTGDEFINQLKTIDLIDSELSNINRIHVRKSNERHRKELS